ncbi:unnamed protein product, partial [Dicrocoelium dendriticum]
MFHRFVLCGLFVAITFGYTLSTKNAKEFGPNFVVNGNNHHGSEYFDENGVPVTGNRDEILGVKKRFGELVG